MSFKITGLQQAQDALRKELEKLQGGKFALVGIHEDAEYPKDAGISMATLGAIQHFGNARIPARRWLDVGVESGFAEYLAIIEEGIASGKTQEHMLEEVGAAASGYARQWITDLKEPPNALSTIRQKALKKDKKTVDKMAGEGATSSEIQEAVGTNPLIRTGAMRGSVTHKITNFKPEEGL